MNILSDPIQDKKINSYNFLVQMSMIEYYSLVSDCISNNEFQRNKVKSSKSIYSLLKQDLVNGCIIPPIVLSLSCTCDKDKLTDKAFLEKMMNDNKDKLMILDGLQRTFTIQDIVMQAKSDSSISASLENLIRVEIYLGLNREGVLYRMLTLNTGQTPMKLRHQVEIIYSSLLNQETEGYKLIKDTDTAKGKNIGEYKFSDAIDCFTSYMEGDYLQINRDRLLDTIKSFDNISKLGSSQDLFDMLIRLYAKFTKFVDKSINERGEGIIEALNEIGSPFGKDAHSIFDKSQPMTGFGAAISKLMAYQTFKSLEDIDKQIPLISLDEMQEAVSEILLFLDEIKRTSRKIGNSQRCFFYYFFKALFDIERREEYLHPLNALDKAKQDYNRDY